MPPHMHCMRHTAAMPRHVSCPCLSPLPLSLTHLHSPPPGTRYCTLFGCDEMCRQISPLARHSLDTRLVWFGLL